MSTITLRVSLQRSHNVLYRIFSRKHTGKQKRYLWPADLQPLIYAQSTAISIQAIEHRCKTHSLLTVSKPVTAVHPGRVEQVKEIEINFGGNSKKDLKRFRLLVQDRHDKTAGTGYKTMRLLVQDRHDKTAGTEYKTMRLLVQDRRDKTAGTGYKMMRLLVQDRRDKTAGTGYKTMRLLVQDRRDKTAGTGYKTMRLLV
ncbi:hypothetical protein J6590_042350 [Homalodisca vitripennis]|nr:hypothetical protein J6590_042350 [Homalodisca vitripennis]